MDIRIVCDREQSYSLKVIFGALGKTPKEYPSRYDKNEVRFYIKLKDEIVDKIAEKIKENQKNLLDFKEQI
nr:hypothetical protein [uncultured Campylobacter sp.]